MIWYVYIYIGMIMLCIHTYNQIHPYNHMSKSQEIRIARNDFCRSSVELGTFSGARMCPGTRAWVWTGTWTSFRGSCVEPWCHKTPARQTRGGSWGSGENGWKSWAGEVAESKELEALNAYLHLCILAEDFFQEATIGKATLMKGFIMWHWWRGSMAPDFFVAPVEVVKLPVENSLVEILPYDPPSIFLKSIHMFYSHWAGNLNMCPLPCSITEDFFKYCSSAGSVSSNWKPWAIIWNTKVWDQICMGHTCWSFGRVQVNSPYQKKFNSACKRGCSAPHCYWRQSSVGEQHDGQVLKILQAFETSLNGHETGPVDPVSGDSQPSYCWFMLVPHDISVT